MEKDDYRKKAAKLRKNVELQEEIEKLNSSVDSWRNKTHELIDEVRLKEKHFNRLTVAFIVSIIMNCFLGFNYYDNNIAHNYKQDYFQTKDKVAELRQLAVERYNKGYDKGYEEAKEDMYEPDRQDYGGTLVYVTDSGTKYHQKGCSYLRGSSNPMPLSDAKSYGYTPCSRCN